MTVSNLIEILKQIPNDFNVTFDDMNLTEDSIDIREDSKSVDIH